MGKKKILIKITELKPGMLVAQDVRANGLLLASKEMVLTENIIEKLKSKYFESQIMIYTEDDEFDSSSSFIPKSKTVEEVQESFTEFSSDMEEIFDFMEMSGKADIEEVRKFAKKIQDELDSPSAVIKNIVLYGSGSDAIYRHSVNVAALSSILGSWIGLTEKDISLLTYAAILHDFGKTKIDKRILDKSETLSSKEWQLIKSHPVIGYNILKEVPYLHNSVSHGVLMHHERLDGSGYPFGIKDDKIHPFAKIIAITDTFDAINSDRSYKKSEGPFIALEIIQKESLGKLDYKYCKIFLDHIVNYYMGENVLLNSKEICKIIQVNINDLSRPLVLKDSEFIDLKYTKDLYVEKLVL